MILDYRITLLLTALVITPSLVFAEADKAIINVFANISAETCYALEGDLDNIVIEEDFDISAFGGMWIAPLQSKASYTMSFKCTEGKKARYSVSSAASIGSINGSYGDGFLATGNDSVNLHGQIGSKSLSDTFDYSWWKKDVVREATLDNQGIGVIGITDLRLSRGNGAPHVGMAKWDLSIIIWGE